MDWYELYRDRLDQAYGLGVVILDPCRSRAQNWVVTKLVSELYIYSLRANGTMVLSGVDLPIFMNPDITVG